MPQGTCGTPQYAISAYISQILFPIGRFEMDSKESRDELPDPEAVLKAALKTPPPDEVRRRKDVKKTKKKRRTKKGAADSKDQA